MGEMNYTVLLMAVVGVHVINSLESAKILGIFPVGARSHYILGSSLMRGLAEKGHDVTIISPFSEKNVPKNGTYRDLVLTGFVEDYERKMKEMDAFEMEKSSPFVLIPMFTKIIFELSEKTLSHPIVQKLINSEEHFDVVIVEQFMNDAHKAFATHFNAPLVLFNTIGTSSWVNPLVGNPTELSYVSEALFGFPSNMTFYQRSVNTLMYIIQRSIYEFYMFPQQSMLVKKYFPKSPKLNDIVYNISLVLLNSHPSFNQPVPYVPNMIDIGGFHVMPPKKLPKDLQEFLDNAKDGVIYFSMGSNVKGSLLPSKKRQILLDAFSKRKEKVLWKWEEDVLPGQSSNVRVGKWLPQQDILAHPNVKLFITHGGLLSTIETIYHGVPVLVIPLGGDQKLNAQRTVNQGFGLTLSFQEMSEETLTQKINELLINPKYANNAKSRSKIFHDRNVSPMDDAVYWIEYVVRHRGAPHLRVASLDLPWYKYFLLDVIFVGLSVGLVVLYVFYWISKNLLSLCCKNAKQKMKTN